MEYLESKTLTLKPLSPILIKSGMADTYYGNGAIRIKDNIYIIDTEKLQADLYKDFGLSIIEDLTEILSGDTRDFSLSEYLDNKGYDYKKNIKNISKGIILSREISFKKSNFISSGLNQYFVPGSSLKGAIKTAVLYKMLNKDIVKRQFEESFRIYSQKQGNEKKKFKESFAKKFILNYFQNTNLYDGNESRYKYQNKDNGPYMDFFKAVKVSDSSLVNNINRGKIQILKNINGNFNWKSRNNQTILINSEYLIDEVEITLSIDHNILGLFPSDTNIPFKNIDELLIICREFTQSQWENEKSFFNGVGNPYAEVSSFYNIGFCSTLRVGWGTGLLGVTVDLLLNEEDKRKLRDNVIGTPHNNQIAPLSRRLIFDNESKLLPMGWINLSETTINNQEIKETKQAEQIIVNSPVNQNFSNLIKARIIDCSKSPIIVLILEGEFINKESIMPNKSLLNLGLSNNEEIFVDPITTKKKGGKILQNVAFGSRINK